MKTEREIELEVKLTIAKESIKFLLDYCRRIAQHQVVQNDAQKLQDIRMFLTLLSKEISE